jgi:hypothetical protein
MADQILKVKNHTIGRISTAKNGVQTIKNPNGGIKGTYNPRTNTTKDAKNHTVGTGNLLTTLL